MSRFSPYWLRFILPKSPKVYRRRFSNRNCWNCARLRKSKKVEEITYHENGEMKSYSASCDSMMDLISTYQCDNYWFGTKPDDHKMLCGGLEWKKKIVT